MPTFKSNQKSFLSYNNKRILYIIQKVEVIPKKKTKERTKKRGERKEKMEQDEIIRTVTPFRAKGVPIATRMMHKGEKAEGETSWKLGDGNKKEKNARKGFFGIP